MTVATLKLMLSMLPDGSDDLDITVRCEWEGDTPNGTCFRIGGVVLDNSHDEEGTEFVALDCDQEEE